MKPGRRLVAVAAAVLLASAGCAGSRQRFERTDRGRFGQRAERRGDVPRGLASGQGGLRRGQRERRRERQADPVQGPRRQGRPGCRGGRRPRGRRPGRGGGTRRLVQPHRVRDQQQVLRTAEDPVHAGYRRGPGLFLQPEHRPGQRRAVPRHDADPALRLGNAEAERHLRAAGDRGQHPAVVPGGDRRMVGHHRQEAQVPRRHRALRRIRLHVLHRQGRATPGARRSR